MRMITGNTSAPATTDKMRSMVLAFKPTWHPAQLLGRIVAMVLTRSAPATRASCPGLSPTMMIRELGAGSAAGPIVPIW